MCFLLVFNHQTSKIKLCCPVFSTLIGFTSTLGVSSSTRAIRFLFRISKLQTNKCQSNESSQQGNNLSKISSFVDYRWCFGVRISPLKNPTPLGLWGLKQSQVPRLVLGPFFSWRTEVPPLDRDRSASTVTPLAVTTPSRLDGAEVFVSQQEPTKEEN